MAAMSYVGDKNGIQMTQVAMAMTELLATCHISPTSPAAQAGRNQSKIFSVLKYSQVLNHFDGFPEH